MLKLMCRSLPIDVYSAGKMKLSLEIKAQLCNVTELMADGSDFRWYIKVCCGNCGEESKWLYAVVEERVPVKGGRGTAHLVIKCKMCGRENNLEILKDSIKPYTDSGRFQTIVMFDCRGLDVVNFDPRAGFKARGEESGQLFSDISLSDKEWYDYDDSANQEVSITDFEFKFVKV